MNHLKKVIGILLAITLVVGVSFPVNATKTTTKAKTVDYVALGDSLAAGITPDGILDYSYTDYVASKFDSSKLYKLVDYDNFGVSGYTSVQLKNDVLKSSKIRKEIKAATHITIDIGANDLLAKLKTDPATAVEAIPEVSANLQIILSTIDKLNPKVKVYVMGYYNPFVYYPQEQQEAMLPLLTNLNAQIKSVAQKNKDTYVATDVVIQKKAKTYLPNPNNIHLSKSGYKVIANEFWKVIYKK
ncbi:SGNH/GDSL hydrolase family protein [Peribacillus sp. Hz7]|uniref:SGNH/GDSL hydrolase family protein n=1 Tax=Peribacillus sp. Hz7 TaxID=3344873 RepID=UPI0035C99848